MGRRRRGASPFFYRVDSGGGGGGGSRRDDKADVRCYGLECVRERETVFVERVCFLVRGLVSEGGGGLREEEERDAYG